MLKYVKGNLFYYVKKDESQLICHIVNDIKVWGSGFVVPLGRKYPEARKTYLLEPKLTLGDVQFVKTNGIYIANMIAQKGIINNYNNAPIKYFSLLECMNSVSQVAKRHNLKIIAPAFGSLRSGGHWPFIHHLIEEVWEDLDVTIFYLDDVQKYELEKPLGFKIK
jgi:hypothetical protein